MRPSIKSACTSGGCWLHHILHDVIADRKPHLGPDAGREAIMKARPDASICNLFGHGLHVAEAVSDARQRGIGQRNLRDVLTSERGFDDARDGAALDAMG